MAGTVGLNALASAGGYHDIGQVFTYMTHFLTRGFKPDTVDAVRGLTDNSLGLTRGSPLLNLITSMIQKEYSAINERYLLVGPLVSNLYEVLNSARSVFPNSVLGNILVATSPPATARQSLELLIQQVETVQTVPEYRTLLQGNKDARKNLHQVMVYAYSIQACLAGYTKDACSANDHLGYVSWENYEAFQVAMSVLWQTYAELSQEDPDLALYRVLLLSAGTGESQADSPPTGLSAIASYADNEGRLIADAREVQIIQSDANLMCSSNGTLWKAASTDEKALQLNIPVASSRQVAKDKAKKLELIASKEALYVTFQDLQAIDLTFAYFHLLENFSNHRGESPLAHISADTLDAWHATMSWIGVTELMMKCFQSESLRNKYTQCLSDDVKNNALALNHATPWSIIVQEFKSTTKYGDDMRVLRHASQLVDYWPKDTPTTTTEQYWVVMAQLLPLLVPDGTDHFPPENKAIVDRIMPPKAQQMLLAARSQEDLNRTFVEIARDLIDKIPDKNTTGEGPRLNATLDSGGSVPWRTYIEAWWQTLTPQYFTDPIRNNANEISYYVLTSTKLWLVYAIGGYLAWRASLYATMGPMGAACGDVVQILGLSILTPAAVKVAPVGLRLTGNVAKGLTNVAVQSLPSARGFDQMHDQAETLVVLSAVRIINSVGFLSEDRAIALALFADQIYGFMRGRRGASASKSDAMHRLALSESARLRLEAPRTARDLSSSSSSSKYTADADTATLLFLFVALS